MIHAVIVIGIAVVSATAAPTVNIAVKGTDGAPLRAVPVIQVELERYNIAVQSVGETDAQGKLSLTFEDRESVKNGDRGYGVYRYVLTPKDRPWTLSDVYIWYPDPARAQIYLDPSFPDFSGADSTNWRYGQRRVLADGDTVEWTPVLPDRRPVYAAVYDDWGFPIPNTEIRVSVDLCALSHTGFGGEIPFGNFTTDKEGHFSIPNAGDFVYSFDIVENTGKTIASNRYIAPDPRGYHYTVMRPLSSPFQVVMYHRLANVPLTVDVTDASTGKPIPNATVCQVILFPSAAQGGPAGQADKNGHYHTDAFHPEHTRGIAAFADGYETAEVPYAPDQEHYTVSLPLKPPAKQP